MKLGEAQNLFSVIIGLNIAYYAFRDLRDPHIQKFTTEVDRLKAEIHETAQEKYESEYDSEDVSFAHQLDGEASQLQQELRRYVRGISSLYFENLLGVPSLAIAVAFVVTLIISTIKYEQELPISMLLFFVVLGFLPVVLQIALNFGLLWMIKRKFGKRYSTLLDRYLARFHRRRRSLYEGEPY
jgi:hypothetical protein